MAERFGAVDTPTLNRGASDLDWFKSKQKDEKPAKEETAVSAAPANTPPTAVAAVK